MSSYEENCRDYELHGNPMREEMEYEENARYDRWDGHRSLCTAGYHPHWDDAEGDFVEPAPKPAPKPEVPFDDDVPF